MSKYAIVLAGGLGTKFWPKSTEKIPKQFTHVFGEATCIQNTYNRCLNYFDKDKIYFVTSIAHKELIESQLPDLNKNNFIYEPFGRNTAPATALAINYILNDGASEEASFAILPADHYINNINEFNHSLDLAFNVADKLDSIVTIGLTPDRPETQFGYIQVNLEQPIKEGNYYNIFHCETFAEKPDIGTAQRFIESGDFLWNSGIFVWKISTFNKAMKRFLPEYYDRLNSIREYFNQSAYFDQLNYQYKQLNPLSLDYGILEKADNVVCIKSDFLWSDLGNWDELYSLQMKDANGNVLLGDVISIDNKNCFVDSNGKLIALVGLEDLIVVDSGDATVICKRGEADRVQEIVDFLRRNLINKYL
ncbi:MAG TPA: sugar phosphate nucleotidyltransferase [Candidatus Kapabacteria bacterium]|nr:sugar phosphate nucleotidyltransferase [Candidatus Kapabacteria bacterium]